ncbi:MAG TPA: TIM barrel protein [Candidatus Saccharimonadales bacterium]|nr:TIM barrel protein [Candidatus Saccharimonadales bacterium]
MKTSLSRRNFVKASIVAATALGLKPLWAQKATNPRISVQLYSVRNDCAQDFDAALAKLAKMGFAGVEFAGYHKYSGKAQELRNKLDELKLEASGTHIGLDSFHGDALKRTIEFHQILGCKFLIVPGAKDFTDHEKSKALAENFNETAEALKPMGMYCGYHNHTHEFTKDGDTTYWDLFAQRTHHDVVLQQDCGWTAEAGYNPAELVRRYPGRTKTTHFKPIVVNKEPGKKAILGQDSVDWPPVLGACREVGGTQWVSLEQEFYPDGKSPMECTELSLEGLQKIW